MLKNTPASGQKGVKWGERARCGIYYLGFSPLHARSVCLVLSLTSGMVSPQFHIKADEHFKTVAITTPSKATVYQSLWQRKYGFATDLHGEWPRLTMPPNTTIPINQLRLQHAPPLPRFQPRTPKARQPTTRKPAKQALNHLINQLPPAAQAPSLQAIGHQASPDSDSDKGKELPPLIPRTRRRLCCSSTTPTAHTRHTDGHPPASACHPPCMTFHQTKQKTHRGNSSHFAPNTHHHTFSTRIPSLSFETWGSIWLKPACRTP